MSIEWAFRRRALPCAPMVGLWAALAGLVMGATALRVTLDLFGMETRSPAEILLVALPTSGLCAAAVALGARLKDPLAAGGATLIASLLAGCLCAAPTFAWTMCLHGEPVELGPTVAAGIVGAFYGAPLGALFGVFFAATVAATRVVTARASCSASDGMMIVLGLGWMLVGASCGAMGSASDSLAVPSAAGWALSVAGCVAAALGVLRFELRRRALARVRDGRVAGWSVEPRDGADAPALFAFGEADAVVVSHHPLAQGPFRTGDERRVWAAVPSR